MRNLYFTFLSFIFCLISLIFLPCCIFKHSTHQNLSVHNQAVPIFISIPVNNKVYENIAPLVYDIFVEYFELVGYQIFSKSSNAYSINITIKSLDPVQKYVSPDILLFNSNIKMELECELLNFNKDVVTKSSFYFYHLLPKPKNTEVSSDFLDFEYKRMLKNAMPRIEQKLRPYLLGKR